MSAAIVLVWTVNVNLSLNVVRGALAAPAMCSGLDALEHLDRFVPPGGQVVFVGLPDNVESGRTFFCTQYSVAPRVVAMGYRPAIENYLKPGTTLFLFIEGAGRSEDMVRNVVALSADRGLLIEWRRITESLLLATVSTL